MLGQNSNNVLCQYGRSPANTSYLSDIEISTTTPPHSPATITKHSSRIPAHPYFLLTPVVADRSSFVSSNEKLMRVDSSDVFRHEQLTLSKRVQWAKKRINNR